MEYLHNLGIVAIMKNEAPYLKEWLDYHLNAGVDIIYLYDNDSDDAIEEIVKPYVESSRVVYHKFPGEVAQIRCYQDAVLNYRYSCKYLAFIDADEFIYPTDNGSIKDFVNKFFNGKENLGSLYIYWYFFGSSGEESADFSRGVLERFQKRSDVADEFGKSVINPRKTFGFISTLHDPETFSDVIALNENEEDVHKKTDKIYPAEKIFVAHFAAKSMEEWLKRKSQGNAFDKRQVNLNEDGSINFGLFVAIDQNKIEDKRLYEYYLKNLNAPIEPTDVKIETCISDAIEVLRQEVLDMEEYLSAVNILSENKKLIAKDKQVEIKKLFKSAFPRAVKNINNTFMELFLEDLPYLIKLNIIDKESLKKIAGDYYAKLEIYLLSNRDYVHAARLRENKKYMEYL